MECQIIIDSTVVSKNIGRVFGMTLHWKPRVVMTTILSLPRLSLWWQLAGTTVMQSWHYDNFPILDITHGPVNIRITIAIHCHSQRFLESENLSYYRVFNTLVRVTVHNTRRVILNNEWISCDKWVTSVNCVLACLEIKDTGLSWSI